MFQDYGTGKPVNQRRQGNVKCNCDSKKSGHRNRATLFNLLPVPRGETEGNHVFLRVMFPLPDRANPAAQSRKKFSRV